MEEIRRLGKLRVAVQFVAVSLSTVRRAIVTDVNRYGREHPSSLGALINRARSEHLQAQKDQRERARRRRLAQEEAKALERRMARAKAGAAARWAGRR